MSTSTGVKKELFASVVIAAATALAVRVAEMTFDKVREQVERKQQQATKPKRKRVKR